MSRSADFSDEVARVRRQAATEHVTVRGTEAGDTVIELLYPAERDVADDRAQLLAKSDDTDEDGGEE